MMTPEDRFKNALLTGAATSPFRLDVVLKVNGQAIAVPRCQGVAGTNKAEHDEYGVEQVSTISVHIPKEALTEIPKVARDAVTHKGKSYKIVNVDGGDDCSPFWAIDGEAPL